ncbi:MAG TPA: DUF3617 domain-containing protein [Rhizomicrobium sp.]|jgi:hypothetical protein|nr:DUF3617 domain-containing protein [Rhizomicrobium sp.]
MAAAVLAGSLGLLVSSAQAASLNVKTGLWETTSQAQVSGAPPVPQAALDKMPPEARAKMDAAVKGIMAAMSKPHTARSCVTQDQIDKAFADMGKNQGDCKRTSISGSDSEQTFQMVCKSPHGTMTGNFHIAAANPETVNGVFDMAVVGEGNTMKIHTVMQGRWISAGCGDIKPGDVKMQ